MQKRWVTAEPISTDFTARFPEIPQIVLQILANRKVLAADMPPDVAQKALDEFMNPDYGADIHDPFLFRDMRKAVDRIARAIKAKEKIVVYGDYDADGVSGAVILTSTLEALGASFDVYIPHRETEGYGLNRGAVDTIADGGARVLITCDCGISNREEVVRANERGIDVIITDHHTIPAMLPPAYAIIHPLIEGEHYPFKGLAGGGVAFKFAQGLLRTLSAPETSPEPSPPFDPSAFEKWLLDMVVVSTVADMMPLIGENRTLAKYGLVVLNKTRRIGLQTLIDRAGLQKKDALLDTYTIGWGIAPRINAAGRMNHANVAYRLCMTKDANEAVRLADELNAANAERQTVVKRIVEEVTALLVGHTTEPALLALGDGWPLGLVGLVAGKISEKFYRPTVIVTNRDGEIAGSGRSIPGFNMIRALQQLPGTLFKRFGGHPMACGFTLADVSQVSAFHQALMQEAQKSLVPDAFIPQLKIDGEIALTDIHWDLWQHLEHLEPFGEGNPRPRYVARGVRVSTCSRVGAEGAHLRCTVEQGGTHVQCIGFGLGDHPAAIAIGDTLDIVFEIDVNEWNGNRTLQLKIVDIKKLGNSATTEKGK